MLNTQTVQSRSGQPLTSRANALVVPCVLARIAIALAPASSCTLVFETLEAHGRHELTANTGRFGHTGPAVGIQEEAPKAEGATQGAAVLMKGCRLCRLCSEYEMFMHE